MDTWQYWFHTITLAQTDEQITEDLTNLGSRYYELVTAVPRIDGRVACILKRSLMDDQQETQHEYLVRSVHEDISDDDLARQLEGHHGHELVTAVRRDSRLTCFYRLVMPAVFIKFIGEIDLLSEGE